MAFLKKIVKLILNKKEVEVAHPKTNTEFLKNVTVTAMEQEFKPPETRKIILFEDSETWSAIVKKALENEGYSVSVYNNPKNAIEIIKEEKPALVLMDVNMPEMSGHEATKLIKSKHANKDLPIIILTSANTPKDKMDAMLVGARTFLTKDQPLEDLVVAINAYMTNTALKSDISQIIKLNKQIK
ncbi:MAG: hypothetical protein ACD_79C01391G0007 [uncultured bacterium]|nr:MAG: hypothetical protein ACD_79C01391G0007 [uncultured bacterium]